MISSRLRRNTGISLGRCCDCGRSLKIIGATFTFLSHTGTESMVCRLSLRLVPACVADQVWRRHALVRQVHRHPRCRVVEVVAVVHPDARIVGAKADLEYLAGLDLQRVRPPGATDDWLTI